MERGGRGGAGWAGWGRVWSREGRWRWRGVEGLSEVEQVDDRCEEGPLLAVHVEHPVARAQHGVDREEPLLRVERRQLHLRAAAGARHALAQRSGITAEGVGEEGRVLTQRARARLLRELLPVRAQLGEPRVASSPVGGDRLGVVPVERAFDERHPARGLTRSCRGGRATDASEARSALVPGWCRGEAAAGGGRCQVLRGMAVRSSSPQGGAPSRMTKRAMMAFIVTGGAKKEVLAVVLRCM